MSIITARNLTRHYGRRIGARDIDLDVPEGALYGFLGPNGAGKTTTIRMLLGFLKPSEGEASVFGLDCWRNSHRIKRDVGYVPGDLRLYPWLTARLAISLAGRLRGLDLKRAGADLADRFKLEMNVPVRKMSRGMRQKLGLIIAMAHTPRLLVLDEPTSGLDPLMRDALSEHLRDLAEAGHTVFFSSHTLSEVEELCDHVAIVRAGRLVADESLHSLRSRARRTFTIRFRDDAAAGAAVAPDFATVNDRHGAEWRGEIDGAAAELVKWVATQPIADVTIGPPDLSTLFRAFYRDDDDAAEPSGDTS